MKIVPKEKERLYLKQFQVTVYTTTMSKQIGSSDENCYKHLRVKWYEAAIFRFFYFSGGAKSLFAKWQYM